jgi:hypothetical protein
MIAGVIIGSMGGLALIIFILIWTIQFIKGPKKAAGPELIPPMAYKDGQDSLSYCKGNPHLTHQLTNLTDILMTDMPTPIRLTDFFTTRQADFLQFDWPTF